MCAILVRNYAGLYVLIHGLFISLSSDYFACEIGSCRARNVSGWCILPSVVDFRSMDFLYMFIYILNSVELRQFNFGWRRGREE